MLDVRKDFQFLVFIYICIAIALWYNKPRMMFQDGMMKSFGVGHKKTIFSYPFVLILLAILMFYVFEVIMLKKTNFL